MKNKVIQETNVSGPSFLSLLALTRLGDAA